MPFNSYTFIIFFGIVLAFHYSPLSWQAKKTNLLIASYIFYAARHPPFIILLIICTFADWFAAKGVASSERRGRRLFFSFLCPFCKPGHAGFFQVC